MFTLGCTSLLFGRLQAPFKKFALCRWSKLSVAHWAGRLLVAHEAISNRHWAYGLPVVLFWPTNWSNTYQLWATCWRLGLGDRFRSLPLHRQYFENLKIKKGWICASLYTRCYRGSSNEARMFLPPHLSLWLWHQLTRRPWYSIWTVCVRVLIL